jgi:hypothetical protein
MRISGAGWTWKGGRMFDASLPVRKAGTIDLLTEYVCRGNVGIDAMKEREIRVELISRGLGANSFRDVMRMYVRRQSEALYKGEVVDGFDDQIIPNRPVIRSGFSRGVVIGAACSLVLWAAIVVFLWVVL